MKGKTAANDSKEPEVEAEHNNNPITKHGRMTGPDMFDWDREDE